MTSLDVIDEITDSIGLGSCLDMVRRDGTMIARVPEKYKSRAVCKEALMQMLSQSYWLAQYSRMHMPLSFREELWNECLTEYRKAA